MVVEPLDIERLKLAEARLKKGESVIWTRRNADRLLEEYARDVEGRWWARLPGTPMLLVYRTVVPRSAWSLMGDKEPRCCDEPPEGCNISRHKARLPKNHLAKILKGGG